MIKEKISNIKAFSLSLFMILFGLPAASHAISVNIQSFSEDTNCALSVSGVVDYTRKLPATAVTIDFIPPSNAATVRLATNIALQAGGTFKWSGKVPGYASLANGSLLKVTTNRQINSTVPVQACTPPAQSSTITFSGLVVGGSTNSYTESGYTLVGQTCGNYGCIYASDYGLTPPAKAAYLAASSLTFKLASNNGAPFSLSSLKLRNLNSTVGAQSLTFTGNLAGGGTVSHTVTTVAGSLDYAKFMLPATFTNLSSVTWSPNLTVVTDVKVGQ